MKINQLKASRIQNTTVTANKKGRQQSTFFTFHPAKENAVPAFTAIWFQVTIAVLTLIRWIFWLILGIRLPKEEVN